MEYDVERAKFIAHNANSQLIYFLTAAKYLSLSKEELQIYLDILGRALCTYSCREESLDSIIHQLQENDKLLRPSWIKDLYQYLEVPNE